MIFIFDILIIKRYIGDFILLEIKIIYIISEKINFFLLSQFNEDKLSLSFNFNMISKFDIKIIQSIYILMEIWIYCDLCQDSRVLFPQLQEILITILMKLN